MPDRSRLRTALLALASAVVTVAGALLLVDAFEFVAAPLRITLTPAMRLAVVGAALLGVVPTTAGAVLRARRPSSDFLHRR